MKVVDNSSKKEQIEMGIENKQCKYCNEIKHRDRFRHNRLTLNSYTMSNLEHAEKFKR